MRVVGNNLLVELDPEKRTSEGGILIPDNVVPRLTRTGKVLDVGSLTGGKVDGRVSVPGIKRGDHVAFVRFVEVSGANPQIKKTLSKDVLCIRPADVLLVMDAEDVNRVG